MQPSLLSQIAIHAKNRPSQLAIKDNFQSLSYESLYETLIRTTKHFKDNISTSKGVVVVNVIALASRWVNILALRLNGFTTISISDFNLLKELRIDGVIAVVHEKLTKEDFDVLNENLPTAELVHSPNINLKSEFEISSISFNEEIGGHIEYTSGSTGNFKTILRDGQFLHHLIQRAISEFDIKPDSRFYLGGFHPGTGVGSKVPLACLFLGATCIFDQSKDTIIGLLTTGADRTFMTPVMIRALSKATLKNNFDIAPFRLYCGGGFLDSELAQQIKDKFNCSIYLNYAATECGVVLQSEVKTAEDTIWLNPLGNKKIQLVDDNGNHVKPTDKEGILKVELESCDPKNYLNDKVTSEENFQQGFFITGDIVNRRADGKIRILGREKNVINLGGEKKAVEPIEQLVMSILKVSNACLFSSQNETGRSVLITVLETDHLPQEETLKEFALTIGKFFSKVEIHLLHKFPCQTIGMLKLDRKAIKNSLTEQTLKSTLTLKFN